MMTYTPELVNGAIQLEGLTVNGLTDAENDTVRGLFKEWRKHYSRNLLRSLYYDGEQSFHDFGISVPDSILANIEQVLDWPRMVVRSLSDLTIFQGFTSPTQDGTPFDLAPILQDNDFETELSQAIISCYKHSCSFVTVMGGDIESGQPEIVVMPRAADWSTALWDQAKRRISAALAITSTDKENRPTEFDVYLPDVILSCARTVNNRWQLVRRQRHSLGRPPIEPLRYDPQLNRPFGRSRISRAVMGLTNAGWRTFVRMETTSEFYTAPQLWFLGLDPDAFQGDKWTALMGHANSVSKDEDGDVPELKQLSQASMQPHLDSLSMITRMVAASCNLPASAFGIVSDNPESAEAMDTAYKRLIREAKAQNRLFSSALARTARMIVSLRDNLGNNLTDELRSLTASFEPISMQSPAGVADAFSKYSSAIDGFAGSESALRWAGFDSDTITQLEASIKRQNAQNTLDKVLALKDTNDQQN